MHRQRYTVTDKDGVVVQEGEARITDTGFLDFADLDRTLPVGEYTIQPGNIDLWVIAPLDSEG